ncbi:hypothetical protein QQF64_030101, partial [Cirrhinus molitorella]
MIGRPGHGGQRPFQCRYCPYSASQKGNLKTHVLCVHRMPFDNSQYPDRRFKRSRIDSDVSGNSEDGNYQVNTGEEHVKRNLSRLYSRPTEGLCEIAQVSIIKAPFGVSDKGQ